jgi:hypothetical protein
VKINISHTIGEINALSLFTLLDITWCWSLFQCASDLLKGKCALGPFLSILVFECQHKCFCVKL